MSKGSVLIIGGGASGRVVAHKCAQIPEVFKDITLVSRTIEKPKRIQEEVRYLYDRIIDIAKIDAENTSELVDFIKWMEHNKKKPEIAIHVALPYQNFSIMDACLETGVNYLDTANPEIREKPGFTYEGQWAYDSKFKEKGLIALLGCGFDPGVTSVYVAYARKHFLDNIKFVDILDCNAGTHGQEFATNFDPEINIKEITLPPKYFDREKGWVQTAPIIDESKAIHFPFNFPVTGKKEAYLLYHEELESLSRNLPEIQRARFWMTFGTKYLKYLRAFVKYGLNNPSLIEFPSNNISPIEMLEKIKTAEFIQDKETQEMFTKIGLMNSEKREFPSNKISPVVMLASVLPKPENLGSSYTGKTAIGNIMRGTFNGNPRAVFIYNICDHAKCFQEVGSQAISYTAAAPAPIGAKMIMEGKWQGKGVYNLEQLDPDPFMIDMDKYGLPWQVEEFDEHFFAESNRGMISDFDFEMALRKSQPVYKRKVYS